MKKIVLSFIHGYQTVFSQGIWKYIFFIGGCRFTPTCSEYAYQTVKKYGTIRGLWKGLLRILRCHPWNKGGYDPVK